MRARTVLLAALALAAAAVISFRPMYDPDLWWHLAQGRETAAGRLVRTNVFNYLHASYPQAYTPWLFDLGAFAAWRAAGGAGIQAAQAGLLALAFGLTFAACRARGTAASAVLAVMVLGFFVVEPRALPRPHLASFAGLAAIAFVVERARARGRAAPLLAAVPVVALWSNLHVEAFVGAGLVGLFACSEIVRPLALTRREGLRALAIAAGCLAATLANPYGWGIAAYLLENWQVPAFLNIAELRPAYLPTYRPFFVYLAAAALLLAWRPRAAAPWEAAALLVFGLLGARFLRFTPLLFFATAPVVAARMARLIERGLDGRALLAIVLAGSLATARQPLRVFARLGAGTQAVAPREFFPPGFGRAMREAGLHGPVFTSMNLGGFVAWEMYPQAQVYQDSRLQAVPPEHFLRTLAASRDPEAWEALMAGVEWAVISLPRPNQLSGAGHFTEAGWGTIFDDGAVRVAVRRGGKFEALLRR